MEMTFAERVQMAVDEARSAFVISKVRNFTKRAGLRCPEADVRSVVPTSPKIAARPASGRRARYLRLRRAQSERRVPGADGHRRDLPLLRAREGNLLVAHAGVLHHVSRPRGPLEGVARAHR